MMPGRRGDTASAPELLSVNGGRSWRTLKLQEFLTVAHRNNIYELLIMLNLGHVECRDERLIYL